MSLEELLSAVESALLLKGDFTEWELALIGEAWSAGLKIGAARVASLEAEREKREEDQWYVETLPTGEGVTELRKARRGESLNAGEALTALRAAMEVADAAKRRGQKAESLLGEWRLLGNLSGGGYGGDLEARTDAALRSGKEEE